MSKIVNCKASGHPIFQGRPQYTDSRHKHDLLIEIIHNILIHTISLELYWGEKIQLYAWNCYFQKLLTIKFWYPEGWFLRVWVSKRQTDAMLAKTMDYNTIFVPFSIVVSIFGNIVYRPVAASPERARLHGLNDTIFFPLSIVVSVFGNIVLNTIDITATQSAQQAIAAALIRRGISGAREASWVKRYNIFPIKYRCICIW